VSVTEVEAATAVADAPEPVAVSEGPPATAVAEAPEIPVLQQLPNIPEAPFAGSVAPQATAPEASEKTELDALLPEPGAPFTLSNGMEIKLKPLKMREMLKLLRIITRGGTVLLPQLRFNGVTESEFAIQFASVVAFAIPEAEDYAVDFVQWITIPADLKEGPDLSDASKNFNKQQIEELWKFLYEPELEDLIVIIERLVQAERGNLMSLGKRLRTMFTLAERTGQLPKTNPAS
jgi:hypothetical protein